MPYYRRYRRRRSPFRRARVYRYRGIRGSRSRATFAAADSMRDQARFVIRYRATTDPAISPSATNVSVAMNMFQLLAQNPQYSAFAGMFDQVKINAIRVRLVPTYQVASDATIRPTLVYAWDRNGLGATTPPIFDRICQYGSAQIRTVGLAQSNVITTAIYASDLAERTTYVSTLAIQAIAGLTETSGNNSVPFNPVLLLGISLPKQPPATYTYGYNIEAAFDLTFRGVRFTG